MRRSSTSLLALALPVLILSACSADKSEDAAASSDAVAPAAPRNAATAEKAGPGIGGAVAPGVAFTYAYAITLPAKAITGVQQEHAAACQKLGTTRCRVTGISYEQPGEDRVDARLDFLLTPDIAHAFANEGIAAVEKAAGKLSHASVSGENAGDAITLSQRNSAAVEAEIARLELRLQTKGLTRDERVELLQQVTRLREQQRGAAADRRAKEASIATTPVSFTYASEGLVGGGGTFGRAASASWSSFETALSFVALIAGLALPWVLLGGAAVIGWRAWRDRRVKALKASPEGAQ